MSFGLQFVNSYFMALDYPGFIPPFPYNVQNMAFKAHFKPFLSKQWFIVDSALFFKIVKPRYFLENIDWSRFIPEENFYFFDVSLQISKNTYNGLIYIPDPTTKAEHFQNPTILELLLPKSMA